MNDMQDQQDQLEEEIAKEPSKEEQLKTKMRAYVLFSLILGFVISLLIGWLVFPQVLYSKVDQPIDFSHKQHLALVSDGCDSCHFFREDGTFSGAPTLAQCASCHESVMGSSENEKKFVEEYVSKAKEVPWKIYSKQQDCVFFSHAAHVKLAEMSCETCHGDIGTSTSLPKYKENRITKTSQNIWGKRISGWNPSHDPKISMKMSDCAACHKEAGGRDGSVQTNRDGCLVCHK